MIGIFSFYDATFGYTPTQSSQIDLSNSTTVFEMNKANYYNYIEERLTLLALRIQARGKLNILDLHIHAETFYQDFFNLLFGWNLTNMNAVKQNVEALDLIDAANHIAIQISATASVAKVNGALGKDLSAYKDWTFKFISISKDASALRKQSFTNPHGLVFAPATDIYDVPALLKLLNGWSAGKLKPVYEFIKQELGTESNPLKIETNLAAIVNILAQQDWGATPQIMETCPYEVDRKIDINHLDATRSIIDEYKIHYGRVDRIYSEFNKQGKNRSMAVLAIIQRKYVEEQATLADDALFLRVIDRVVDVIEASVNYQALPFDELELCVNILVVDAFIRCKIFKNPGSDIFQNPGEVLHAPA